MNRAVLFPILAAAIAGLIYLFYPHSETMGGHTMDHSMKVARPAKISTTATVGDMIISNGWTKATLQGQPAGGGFITIANKGATADTLISISSSVSSNVQIHEMAMDGDVMKMRELPDGLALPAGATVELSPGGLHIMFMGLKDGFKEGSMVNITLNFARAGSLTLDLPVNAAAQ